MRVERSRARASGYAAELDVVYASLGGLDGATRGLRVVLVRRRSRDGTMARGGARGEDARRGATDDRDGARG